MNTRRFAILAALVLFVFAPLRGQTPARPDLVRLQKELEPKINDEISKGNLPGFAIGVVKNGKLIYAKGFGVAKLGSPAPITSRSLFHMASVTKTFVATGIMQLVEQGKIDLDAPLTKYLPYFKLADERYRDIKIRQMLSHTSGIPDVVDYHWDKPEYDAGALERFVRSIADQKLVFAPGEKFAYSNTAYEVLGDVIAKVSGESFEDYVQHHILTPLGMKDSTLLVREANAQLLTSPHIFEDQKLVVSKIFPYNRAHAPSSTLYSSIEDMSRWAMANLNHGELDGQRILKKETAESMWRPVVDAPVLKLKEGLSWFTNESGGHHFVLHSGGDVGFESLVVLAPDDSLAVVAMSNLADSDEDYVEEFVNLAVRVMLGVDSTQKSTGQDAVIAAAQLSPEEAHAKADEVLAKYVTALGGRVALEKLTSRVSKGNFEVSGIAMSGPVEFYSKAPNLRRVIFKMAGGQIFGDGYDGHVGWEQSDDGVTDKTGLELGSFARDSDFYQPLKLRQQYPQLSFKGETKITLGKSTGGKVEEHQAVVLEAPRAGSPRRFFFDSTTGLLLRTEEWNTAGKMEEATEYQDYRIVDGVKVPFIINQMENVVFTIRFTEVNHNVAIDDSMFAKPKQ